jgi:hypothetical protein
MNFTVHKWNIAYCFIRSETVLIIGALVALGYILQKIKMVPNRQIPAWIILAGLAFTIGMPTSSFLEAICLGLVYSAFAIGTYGAITKQVFRMSRWAIRKFLRVPKNGEESPMNFKPKLPISAIALACSLGISGCATLPNGENTVNPEVLRDGAKITAYGFTCWAFSLSKGDTQDLADKKEIVGTVRKYLVVHRDQGFNGAAIASGLLSNVPVKEHWLIYVNGIRSALEAVSGPEAVAVVNGLIAGIDQAVSDFP